MPSGAAPDTRYPRTRPVGALDPQAERSGRSLDAAASRRTRAQGRSYELQEPKKKRQYREAAGKRQGAIGNVRAKHGDAMKGRHYLTIVTRDGCYSECGHPLRRGGEAVYRYEPREILCRTCAELRGLEPRPSRSWQRANRRTRSRYLSATLSHHGDYEAAIGDPHYRATSPLAPAA